MLCSPPATYSWIHICVFICVAHIQAIFLRRRLTLVNIHTCYFSSCNVSHHLHKHLLHTSLNLSAPCRTTVHAFAGRVQFTLRVSHSKFICQLTKPTPSVQQGKQNGLVTGWQIYLSWRLKFHNEVASLYDLLWGRINRYSSVAPETSQVNSNQHHLI